MGENMLLSFVKKKWSYGLMEYRDSVLALYRKCGKNIWFIALGLTVLTTFFLFGQYIIGMKNSLGQYKWFVLLVVMAGAFLIVIWTLSKICFGVRKEINPQTSGIWKRDLLWLCIYGLINGLSMLAFNPGITSPDSEDCIYWSKSLGKESVPAGHPIFYLLYLKVIFSICKSLEFALILQIVFYAIIILRGANLLESLGLKRFWCTVILYVIGLAPTSIIQLNTLWKDIPFAISMLWLSLTLIRMIASETEVHNAKWYYLEFVISGTLTAGFRYNGTIVVLFTCILLLVVYHRKTQIVLATIICMSVACFGIPKVMDFYDQTKEPGLKYYALAHDIGYVKFNGGRLNERAQRVVNDLTGNDDKYVFKTYYTTMVRNNFDDYNMLDFVPIYLETFYNNPGIMLVGILKRTTFIWSIERPAGESNNGVNFLGDTHLRSFEDHYSVRQENGATYFLKKVIDMLVQNKFFIVFYCRTAVYTLAMIMVLMMIFAKISMVEACKYALPFVPVLMNLVTFFIASGWPDYRYYWPVMLTAAFLIPYGLLVLGEKNA